MLCFYALLFLPLLVRTQMTTGETSSEDLVNVHATHRFSMLDWLNDRYRDVADTLFPSLNLCTNIEGRKHKKLKLNKYIVPLIVGFLLIKSILLPIALKALAVLSGKAVVLSLMSLILAAIVGLKKVAQSSGHNYEVVNLPSSKYRRKDIYDFLDDQQDNEPYQYYRERRKK